VGGEAGVAVCVGVGMSRWEVRVGDGEESVRGVAGIGPRWASRDEHGVEWDVM
jgi:hypothetical protein